MFSRLARSRTSPAYDHRHCIPVRLSRWDRSARFGRTSAPTIPQQLQAMRGPRLGTGTSSRQGRRAALHHDGRASRSPRGTARLGRFHWSGNGHGRPAAVASGHAALATATRHDGPVAAGRDAVATGLGRIAPILAAAAKGHGGLAWRVRARCPWGGPDTHSRKRIAIECDTSIELDMATLVWTRGSTSCTVD
jgi:hypothetical protein